LSVYKNLCYNSIDMSKATYYDETNRKRFAELEQKLEELPYFCRDFFVGIEVRTSVLTRLGYASDFAVFFDYLVKKTIEFKGKAIKEIEIDELNAVKTFHIERYLSYLSYYNYNGRNYKNGERAKARKVSAVRSLFKYFYNANMLKENVASKVSMPKLREKPIVRLDDGEVGELLDNAEAEQKFASSRQNAYALNTRDRDIALLTLLLGTGIRVSECVGLNVDDISLANKSFIVTRKGGNRTILYFSNEVKDALVNYIHTRKDKLAQKGLDEPEALFLSLQNKRISVRAVENIVKKYAKTAAPLKDISPHKLRSTYGTALYRKTKDIYVVAEVLGHKDINTTKKHYAAIDEDIKKSAAEKVILRDDN